MSRILHNLAKSPSRTVRSVKRMFSPVYKLQREADRHVPAHFPAERIELLDAVPGTSSAREGRLLAYLTTRAPVHENSVIVEIGAYKGKSAAWIIEAAETRSDHPPVVSIDPHAQYDTWDEFSETVAKFDLEKRGLEICRAPSHEVGVKWDRPISLLWIDGSHEYEDVVNDIEDFVPHVVPEGWVVFDDAASDDFGVDGALEASMFPRQEFNFLGYLKHFAIFQRNSMI